jgi:hypothetical protein
LGVASSVGALVAAAACSSRSSKVRCYDPHLISCIGSGKH